MYINSVGCNFWIDTKYVNETLSKRLKLYGFTTHLDVAGNIDDITYEANLSNANYVEMLNRIAPIVRPGSYIEFENDIKRWRCVFSGGKCYEREPVVTCPDPESLAQDIQPPYIPRFGIDYFDQTPNTKQDIEMLGIDIQGYKSFKSKDIFENYPEAVCYASETVECMYDLYTANELIELCVGNKEMAKRLFHMCEWQSPCTLLEEWKMEGEVDSCVCGDTPLFS